MRQMKKMLAIVLALLTMCMVPMETMASAPHESGYTGKTGYQQPIRIDMGKTDETLPETKPNTGGKIYKSTKWDTYSSDYFYNQLNTNQKALYNAMYQLCMSYLVGTANAPVEAVNHTEVSGFTDRILVPAGLSDADAEMVQMLFLTNCPQFYFLNMYYGWGTAANGRYVQLGIYPEWAYGTERAAATRLMEQTIDDYMYQINEGTTTILEKERKAHDLIIQNTEYGYGKYNQSCAGVFLEGYAVCAGYSETFALLCNGIGIDTVCVTSAEHEWNMVNLNGNWYNVDVLWDDQGYVIYDYFNVADSAIREGYHELEPLWSKLNVPQCTNTTVVPSKPILNGIDYSAVYEEDYYLSRYPDIGRAFGADSTAILRHFVNFGMAEGRQGSAEFDVQSYRRQYSDLRKAFGNNLKSYYMHYISNGKREGRQGTGCTVLQGSVTVLNGVDYSAVYDFNYYISTYPDMKKNFANDDIAALSHFVNQGMKEGRQGKKTFSVTSYANQYSDLRRAFGNNLKSYYMHYISNGKREGRQATGCTSMQGIQTVYNGVNYSSVYDFNYYTSVYPDIRRNYGYDDYGALQHFVKYGMAEGRQGKNTFSVFSYYNQYVDLRNAFGKDWKKYYLHYITNGKNEGRVATGCTSLIDPTTVYKGVDYADVYDFAYYTSRNADIKAAFGNDENQVLQHFVEFGMKEGRQASEEFSVTKYAENYPDLQSAFGNDWKAYYLHYMNYGRKEGRTGK